MTELSRMPAAFIGHGSPMNTLEANAFTRAWRELGRTMPRPRAVLAIWGHAGIRPIFCHNTISYEHLLQVRLGRIRQCWCAGLGVMLVCMPKLTLSDKYKP